MSIYIDRIPMIYSSCRYNTRGTYSVAIDRRLVRLFCFSIVALNDPLGGTFDDKRFLDDRIVTLSRACFQNHLALIRDFILCSCF